MLHSYWIFIHRTVLGTPGPSSAGREVWAARKPYVPPVYARRFPGPLPSPTRGAYPPRHRQQRDAVGRSLEGE